MNNFITRSITGIGFVAVTVSLILISKWSLFGLLILLNVLAQSEFLRLVKSDNAKPLLFSSLSLGTLVISFSFFCLEGIFPLEIFWLLLLPLLYVFLEELYSKNPNPLRNASFSFLSVLYISLPIALSLFIVYYDFGETSNYNPEVLLGIFALIWIYDSMAYCVGVPLGKNRLFERVSPKKSWEGTIGGGILTVIAAIFINRFIPILSTETWIIISVIVVVFGTLGDLIESLFKRSIDIKDSGNILPGHGGVLDRIDSFIYVTPWIWLYIVISGII